ncbi:MAG: UDP-N-acetylmuramate dehydrogenase [Planctomycetota bacterium]|jgi:UDP-N-acetylmuramate dehydrogenase
MLPANWRTRSDGFACADEPLAPHTTWRIGGRAELYVEPRSRAELAAVLGALWKSGQRWRMIGGGSNLLIADGGVRDVVISLRRLRDIRVEGTRLHAEAGANLHAVVRRAARAGLAGTEPLAGIPGQLGGAVFGNAGGKDGAIGPLVAALELVAPDGTTSELIPGPGFFRYRKSLIGDRIVVAATLQLMPSDVRTVTDRMRRLMRARKASQPGWLGNAGCVFRNPEGDNAGRLVDSAGCKGLREGGIVVSPIHANFFENPDTSGTSEDVLRLVERVRARVAAVHGIDLEWEVRRWTS